MAASKKAKAEPLPDPPEPQAPSQTIPAPDSLSLKDQMDYAMKHFLFIADQRLKIFQFYLVLMAACVTVTASAFKDGVPMMFFIATVLNLGASLVFWVIEIRNQRLLEVTRNGLRAIESNDLWPLAVRLSLEEGKTKKFFSYKTAFGTCYAGQLVAGLFCGAAFLISLFSPLMDTWRGIQTIMTQAKNATNTTVPSRENTTTQGDTETSKASKNEN